MNPPPAPMVHESRMIDAKLPLPTCDGASLSHSNIRPGPKAAKAAPW